MIDVIIVIVIRMQNHKCNEVENAFRIFKVSCLPWRPIIQEARLSQTNRVKFCQLLHNCTKHSWAVPGIWSWGSNVGQGSKHRGQGKSLWVDKMSTRGHFTKTNISPGGNWGGQMQRHRGSCPPPPAPSSAAHANTDRLSKFFYR